MTLLQMSVAGAIMVLAIIVIRALFMNHLPKRTFIGLWLIALARMMIPFSIPSRFSVYTAANHVPKDIPARMDEPIRMLAQQALPIAPRTLHPLTAPVPQATMAESAPLTTVNWLFVLYIAGVIAISIYLLVVYVLLRREFRRATELTDGAAHQWIHAQKLRRRVRVFSSLRIGSPITYGFIRPCILLPESMASDEVQLPYVLTHEMTHIRRFDAPMKLLFASCLCVHWFNPMVWVMYILYNRDVELACDERVIALLGTDSRQDYARLLLAMQEGQNPLTPLASSFSRYSLKERIVAIMKYKKVSTLAVCLAMIMVLTVATAFATSAELPLPTVNPAWNNLADMFWAPEEESQEQGPDYDKLLQPLLDLYDPHMTVLAFNEAINKVFPGDRIYEIVDLITNYGAGYDYEETFPTTEVAERIEFAYGPLLHAVLEMELSPLGEDNAHHPGDPPGHSKLLFAEGAPDSEQGVSTVYVDYWFGFETLNPENITVSEREQILEAYENQFKAFFEAQDVDALLEVDPIELLHGERDRLTRELSTPAFRVRAININCSLTLRDGTSYLTPRTFIDNLETPPVQTPTDGADIVLKHTTARMGTSYGERSGEGFVSPDNGKTWYENGWRDPKSGICHSYDPVTDILSLSADNGLNWCQQSDAFYPPCIFVAPVKEDQTLMLSYDMGSWHILYDYSPVTSYPPITLTEVLSKFKGSL